ncbi:hypothetical protein LFM09_01105 [Lentzea alba]|uniref:hypothetical protein n=1 Tax=Lentzea alba TaxID=2714351 RepID=UPI0039BEF1CC
MIQENESFKALGMMPWARESVERAERVLIESVIDSGFTWEQLGAAYGERSKQAMQQHYKRRGGERSWRSGVGPPDVAAVRDAIVRLVLNFRATDEALTRTLRDASWNSGDPEAEAYLRRNVPEQMQDALAGLRDHVDNRMEPGEQEKIVEWLEQQRAAIDELIEHVRRS